MSSLNLDAIYQAKHLFNDHISFIYHSNNYSDLKLNELLNRNLTLFWKTMHQCLDLNDLIQQQQLSLLNHSIAIATINQTSNLYTSTQLQSLYTWCNLGRSTWFTNVFTLMHHNSWQEKVSIELQKYLLPILLFMNCLSLLISITGIYHLCKLSNKSNQKIMIIMRCQSIIENYFPATWPLLLWYCIIGFLWLLLLFGLNMMMTSQYFNIHISIHSHDNYCRILTYLKNILRYIPTWLISLMLCDRAIGEYYNRNHIYTMTIFYNHHLNHYDNDQLIINQNRFNQLTNQYCNQCTPNQSIKNQLIIPKIIYNNNNNNNDVTSYDTNDPDQYHSSSKRSCFHSFLLYLKKKFYFDCILYGLKQTSNKQCQLLNRNNDYVTSFKECSNTTNNHDYEILLNDLCHWNECGLSRIGGLVLFSIITSLLCLMNAHLLWLYKISKITKRCVLSAGDAIILSVFYPYLLKVCHSILPYMLIISSIVLLSFIAIHKSRIHHVNPCSNPDNIHRNWKIEQTIIPLKSSIHHSNYQQTLFTEPTQLTICLSLMYILFDLADLIEWFYGNIIIPNYIHSFKQHFNTNFNENYNIKTNHSGLLPLLTNTLNSSMLLTKSMNQLCSIQFISGLLRIWSSQRFLFILPMLLYQSLKYRHLIKYYFTYYFHTLKILHWCKFSYSSSIYIEQTLNTSMDDIIQTELNEMKTTDEEISSEHHQYQRQQQQQQQRRRRQQQQQTIMKAEYQDEYQRIPSLYCCSCIHQTILSK
ncbi:unnamed protein product [Schistosoma bovis]|nr:unnamed protein product [Schistosoma bovis]